MQHAYMHGFKQAEIWNTAAPHVQMPHQWLSTRHTRNVATEKENVRPLQATMHHLIWYVCVCGM